MKADGTINRYTKKEAWKMEKELVKLERNLGGIKDMDELPGAVFIVDPKKENIAVKESRKLGIPIVAIGDTNCDPDELDYIIPGNDDAIRAIRLICSKIADACTEGHNLAEEKLRAQAENQEAPEAEKPEAVPQQERDGKGPEVIFISRKDGQPKKRRCRRNRKLEINASLVKELREKTGVGIMDCKKALAESNGDLEKAVEYLRKKGIATAQKRGGRTTSEGQVQAYIHGGGKIGVLVEVNCETDFTGKTGDFTEFVKNLAMQIAATNPLAIDREGLAPEMVAKERDIYLTQARESGKPEKVLEKIVDGKMKKFYSDVCLLEQPFVKNPDITVQDLLNEMMAKTGENMVIRRFVRYQLGDADGR
jgi:elongation factor Ts